MAIILFFVFSSFVTVGVVMFAARPSPAQKIARARLAQIGKRSTEEPGGIRLADREATTWIDRVSNFVQQFEFGDALDRLIVHSGSDTTVGQVVLTGAAIAAPFGLITQELRGILPLSVLAAALGGSAPVIYLIFKKGRRMHKFTEALPDSIELMARALRAGHSVSSSIEMIAEQSPEPLASEFASCFQQQKFGIPFRDTLLTMGERVPCADLHFFITAVLVQKETGGDLTDILDRTTKLIRDRVRIKGEIKSYTAQGRLTGWILSLLPIILLVLMNLISPGYSDPLFNDPLGKMLVIAGAVMIVIGGFIISRIVDIKV
jgi:tight adherence protein B